MTIKIRIDQNDVAENIEIGDLEDAQSGNVTAMVKIVSRYVVGDDGKTLTPEEGRKVVRKLTGKTLAEAMSAVYGAMADAAVPPLNAAT